MQAQQRAAAYHATTASSEAPAGLVSATDSAEVDSKKRKANGDDGPSDEQQVVTKRTRFDDVAAGVVTTDGDQPTRDREHCTVFVSGLAPGTSEQSIQQRFKDVSFWAKFLFITRSVIDDLRFSAEPFARSLSQTSQTMPWLL
jgi:hypothetical protein